LTWNKIVKHRLNLVKYSISFTQEVAGVEIGVTMINTSNFGIDAAAISSLGSTKVDAWLIDPTRDTRVNFILSTQA